MLVRMCFFLMRMIMREISIPKKYWGEGIYRREIYWGGRWGELSGGRSGRKNTQEEKNMKGERSNNTPEEKLRVVYSWREMYRRGKYSGRRGRLRREKILKKRNIYRRGKYSGRRGEGRQCHWWKGESNHIAMSVHPPWSSPSSFVIFDRLLWYCSSLMDLFLIFTNIICGYQRVCQ